MREIGVSTTLTVYHDGQFWVGTFESVEDGKLSACRIVFGAEPSTEEVQELVCDAWNHLRFTECVAEAKLPNVAGNPKRRQREAARELGHRGPSTKAQQVLAEEREARAQEHKAEIRKRRDQTKKRRFEQRQEKRKRKRRGK